MAASSWTYLNSIEKVSLHCSNTCALSITPHDRCSCSSDLFYLRVCTHLLRLELTCSDSLTSVSCCTELQNRAKLKITGKQFISSWSILSSAFSVHVTNSVTKDNNTVKQNMTQKAINTRLKPKNCNLSSFYQLLRCTGHV